MLLTHRPVQIKDCFWITVIIIWLFSFLQTQLALPRRFNWISFLMLKLMISYSEEVWFHDIVLFHLEGRMTSMLPAGRQALGKSVRASILVAWTSAAFCRNLQLERAAAPALTDWSKPLKGLITVQIQTSKRREHLWMNDINSLRQRSPKWGRGEGTRYLSFRSWAMTRCLRW